jgi:hypothetical protein
MRAARHAAKAANGWGEEPMTTAGVGNRDWTIKVTTVYASMLTSRPKPLPS